MPRILLTEDQEDQRELYVDVLKEAGYEVIAAASAAEALKLFVTTKPDMVVLDIQMPGMDGMEAMSKILAKDRAIPVILYSAYPAYKANFLTWGADEFIVKTGDPGELVSAIRRIEKDRGLAMPKPTAMVAVK
jgi:DNA-binding response OmpR family regulator